MLAQKTTSESVGEMEFLTGSPQDFNSSAWNVDPIDVCNITTNDCSDPFVNNNIYNKRI